MTALKWHEADPGVGPRPKMTLAGTPSARSWLCRPAGSRSWRMDGSSTAMSTAAAAAPKMAKPEPRRRARIMVIAQSGHRATHMRLDGARRDTENLRRLLGIEVEKDTQRHDLTLANGQPQQRGRD